MKTVSIVGQRTAILLSGADTAGQYGLIEIVAPPGSAVPPHIQRLLKVAPKFGLEMLG
jgi:hypothetical protein